jgi:putative tryptophan/tyrosine transport system substrate-binding protein
VKRRQILALLAGAAIMRPPTLIAQSANRLRRVGVLYPFSKHDRGLAAIDAAFRAELARLGWKEGDNLRIEGRWEMADSARVRVLAMELVGLAPDAIFVIGGLGASLLREATRTIPIVFDNVADPVGQGLVSSFAHPGGNITGFTSVEFSMGGRWVQMIKEAAPNVTRVALVFNPDTAPYIKLFLPSMAAAAQTLALEFAQHPINDEAEIERSIGTLGGQPVSGLIVGLDIFTYSHRERIVAVAAQTHLPSVYNWREGPLAGGLMSYGADNVDLARRAASYVDHILKGASPSELPIQRPTKFELIINLKTARALGLTIPPSLLARADEVIE